MSPENVRINRVIHIKGPFGRLRRKRKIAPEVNPEDNIASQYQCSQVWAKKVGAITLEYHYASPIAANYIAYPIDAGTIKFVPESHQVLINGIIGMWL